MKNKARVLIVDDQPEIRELLQEFLELKGFTALTAASGVEALACMREQMPDLALIDVRMPGMDGLETQRRIRAIAPDVNVIMMTGLDDAVIAQQAIRDGARDYLLKPLNLDCLGRVLLAETALTANARSAS